MGKYKKSVVRDVGGVRGDHIPGKVELTSSTASHSFVFVLHVTTMEYSYINYYINYYTENNREQMTAQSRLTNNTRR